jgi:threonine/homoserine/homoserine lactone efflux protein
MKQIIAILLLAGAVYLGYNGINMVSSSGAEVEVLGVELSASDEGQKQTGFICIGLSVIALVSSVFMFTKKVK